MKLTESRRTRESLLKAQKQIQNQRAEALTRAKARVRLAGMLAEIMSGEPWQQKLLLSKAIRDMDDVELEAWAEEAWEDFKALEESVTEATEEMYNLLASALTTASVEKSLRGLQ